MADGSKQRPKPTGQLYLPCPTLELEGSLEAFLLLLDLTTEMQTVSNTY